MGEEIEENVVAQPNGADKSDEKDAVVEEGSDVKKDDEHLLPERGMVFKSGDEAYDYYNRYALVTGFGIKKRGSRSKDGLPFEYTFACSKEGRPKAITDLASSRLRTSARTNCQAKITIRFRSDGLFHLDHVVLEHNHPCSPKEARFFRSHKNLPVFVKKPFEYSDETRHQITKGLDAVGGQVAAYEKGLGLKLGEGDSQAILEYFLRMQKENLRFFYLMDLDELGRLRNVFWADTRARASYPYFSDVILFDTTKSDMPFASFVGVNHHGSPVLLGSSLLADEKIETYIWLFRALLTCMDGLPPKAIITDHCESIGRAVAEAFPGCRHRSCVIQTMKKIREKLSTLPKYNEIKERLQDIVYHSLRTNEFEEQWKEMIETYQLESNEWLTSLFQDRHRWAPVYVKESFWLGISSIDRSESSTSVFDRSVTAKSSLKQFIMAYDAALRGKYEKEAQEDFHSNDKVPPMISRLYMEEQLSKIFTLKMFKKFQSELWKCMDCSVELLRKEGPLCMYEVVEYVKQRRFSYEVLYNEDELEVRCICCGFEFRGILCAHAISVFKQKQLQEVPAKYIIDRWRKDYKRLCHVLSQTSTVISDKVMERYDDLYARYLQVIPGMVEIGSMSRERFQFAFNVLMEAKLKLDKFDLACSDKERNSNTSEACQAVVDFTPNIDEYDTPNICMVSPLLQAEAVLPSKRVSRGRPPKNKKRKEQNDMRNDIINASMFIHPEGRALSEMQYGDLLKQAPQSHTWHILQPNQAKD